MIWTGEEEKGDGVCIIGGEERGGGVRRRGREKGVCIIGG